jgi:serine/threonine-protein kinase
MVPSEPSEVRAATNEAKPRRASPRPEYLVGPWPETSPSDDVPEKTDREITEPMAIGERRGPSHAELAVLSKGNSKPLILADRYLVERKLAHGGMATLYAGRLISLDKPVAIKVLDIRHGRQDNALSRFLAEAQTTAYIRHPNIVEVSDFGSTPEGIVYMVMELLEGEDLCSLLAREGPLPWEIVQTLMLEICAGLAAIHRAGVVHRDLKPANCFLTPTGVKLLDFGIASNERPSTSERLTEEGRVIGTPEYMSPEQAKGEYVNGRSDVYAAGIMLGELLTDEVPFQGKTASAVIAAHIYEPPPTLRDLVGSPVDRELEKIYARSLQKDPAQRYESITDFADAVAKVEIDPARAGWWNQLVSKLRRSR